MAKKKLIFLVILAFLVLLTGCLTANVQTKVSEKGTGRVTIELNSMQEIDKEVNDFFKTKMLPNIQKKKVGSSYVYTISFSFNDVSEVSKNARFSTRDTGDAFEYEYTDLLTSESLTGKKQEIPNLTYCITLPGKVKELQVESLRDTTYDNTAEACVELGSKDSEGKRFTVIFLDKKTGCTYNNPVCGNSYECIDNSCTLKKGCNYNNPNCKENQDCINNKCLLKKGCEFKNPSCSEEYNCTDNQCTLKEGCLYKNPACETNYDCVENQCVQKPFPWGLSTGTIMLGIVIITIIGLGIIGFVIMRKPKIKQAKESK